MFFGKMWPLGSISPKTVTKASKHSWYASWGARGFGLGAWARCSSAVASKTRWGQWMGCFACRGNDEAMARRGLSKKRGRDEAVDREGRQLVRVGVGAAAAAVWGSFCVSVQSAAMWGSFCVSVQSARVGDISDSSKKKISGRYGFDWAITSLGLLELLGCSAWAPPVNSGGTHCW
jgi:hypothetical protein